MPTYRPSARSLSSVTFVTEHYQSAQGLVAAGIGISAVPRLSLVARHPDVIAVPIAPPAPCPGSTRYA